MRRLWNSIAAFVLQLALLAAFTAAIFNLTNDFLRQACEAQRVEVYHGYWLRNCWWDLDAFGPLYLPRP